MSSSSTSSSLSLSVVPSASASQVDKSFLLSFVPSSVELCHGLRSHRHHLGRSPRYTCWVNCTLYTGQRYHDCFSGRFDGSRCVEQPIMSRSITLTRIATAVSLTSSSKCLIEIALISFHFISVDIGVRIVAAHQNGIDSIDEIERTPGGWVGHLTGVGHHIVGS